MKYVLWVDLKNGDLHVLENQGGDGLSLVETMSVSIGKKGFGKQVRGDKKTPVGVYRLIGHLKDKQLDDFYGHGAFTMNYPNAVDKMHRRTGSGIWLHGLPKGTAHRPLKDSDGCVVASNLMIERIRRYIDLGNTAIVLDDDLDWVEERQAKAVGRAVQKAIDEWRQAWMSKDDDRYLSFYGEDFTNLEKDLAAWKRYKRRINKAKRYINVEISDLSLVGYPGEDGLVLARFYQRYESSNFNARGWKEQLWRQDGSGKWRIVYEKG
jgi:murein L,D-transpeptidase YafK